MARTHFKLSFVARTKHMASDNALARENVTVVTLPRDQTFAAGIGWLWVKG